MVDSGPLPTISNSHCFRLSGSRPERKEANAPILRSYPFKGTILPAEITMNFSFLPFGLNPKSSEATDGMMLYLSSGMDIASGTLEFIHQI